MLQSAAQRNDFAQTVTIRRSVGFLVTLQGGSHDVIDRHPPTSRSHVGRLRRPRGRAGDRARDRRGDGRRHRYGLGGAIPGRLRSEDRHRLSASVAGGCGQAGCQADRAPDCDARPAAVESRCRGGRCRQPEDRPDLRRLGVAEPIAGQALSPDPTRFRSFPRSRNCSGVWAVGRDAPRRSIPPAPRTRRSPTRSRRPPACRRISSAPRWSPASTRRRISSSCPTDGSCSPKKAGRSRFTRTACSTHNR